MAATDSLSESELNQQRPQVGESDVRVSSPARDSLTQSFMPVHGPPLSILPLDRLVAFPALH